MPEETTAYSPVEKALVDFYSTTTQKDAPAPEVLPDPEVATPVIEAPVVEAPVVEAPVVVAPVAEAPVVEAPVVEAPKATAVDTEDGFEITLAPDSPLSDADLDDIFALAEKKNLDKDETMALVKNKEDFYNRGRDTVMTQANQVLKAQVDAYNADPLFSTPAARTANEAKIDAALAKFGGNGFKEKFLTSHLKNDLELAKFIHAIGEVMEGDEIRMTGIAHRAPTQVEDTRESRLMANYPEHFKK